MEVNGTVPISQRICLAPKCHRSARRKVCWLHLARGAFPGFDPLESDCSDWNRWWKNSQPRLAQLREILENFTPTQSRTLSMAKAETIVLHNRILLHRIPAYVQQYRATRDDSFWRLPPDGWIWDAARTDFPEMVPIFQPFIPTGDLRDEVTNFPKYLDYLARHIQEHTSPTQHPFVPITRRRMRSIEHVKALAAQEETNLSAFHPHSNALHSLKHEGGTEGMSEVFDDPDIDTSLPSDLIVYHQIRQPADSPYPSLQSRYQRFSFDRHMQLKPGDTVAYTHVRSSTTKVRWFSSIASDPSWLNTDGDENGLQLELHPRKGIFLSEASNKVIKSHLGSEEELVLPASTFWRVVAVSDVVQSDGRFDYHQSSQRLRAVQMVEFNPADARALDVQILTT